MLQQLQKTMKTLPNSLSENGFSLVEGLKLPVKLRQLVDIDVQYAVNSTEIILCKGSYLINKIGKY